MELAEEFLLPALRKPNAPNARARSVQSGRVLGEQFVIRPVAQGRAGDRLGLQRVLDVDQVRVGHRDHVREDGPHLPDLGALWQVRTLRVALAFLDLKPLCHERCTGFPQFG